MTTHVDGVAYSIASLMAMGGAEIRMAENAMLMVHAPWGVSVGNAQALREAADVLDTHAEAMLGAYLRDGGPDAATVRGWLTDGKDHYFTTAEAQALGLVDTLTEPVPIPAALREGAQRRFPGRTLPAAAAARHHPGASMATQIPPAAPAEPTAAPDVNPTQIVGAYQAAAQAASVEAIAQEMQRQKAICGLRMIDIARAAMQRAGVKMDGLDYYQVARAALGYPVHAGYSQTRSDFPVIIQDVLHQMLLAGYMAAKITWPGFCKTGTVTDFRDWQRLTPGLMGTLDDVDENGEYKNKPILDAEKNTITATRHGNIIAVSPATIVDDNLGYIDAQARDLGNVAARSIERDVWTLLNANPTLDDGVVLFHASHSNIVATSGAPTVAIADAMAAQMASQTAPGTDAEYLRRRGRSSIVALRCARLMPDGKQTCVVPCGPVRSHVEVAWREAYGIAYARNRRPLMITITATEARKLLYKLLDDVSDSHEPVQITGRRGNAILLSQEDWDAVQETLYLVSIPGMRESILEGMATPVDELEDKLDW